MFKSLLEKLVKLKKSLWIEIKNSIFTSWFHLMRFIGLLIIPLLYGFSYVFAFWDPFTKMDKLPIAFAIEQKVDNKKESADPFGVAIGKCLSKGVKAKIGDLDMTIAPETIYYNKSDKDKAQSNGSINSHTNKLIDSLPIKDYSATIVLPNIYKEVLDVIKKVVNPTSGINISVYKNLFEKILNDNILMITNFKKNYLIGFGMDVSSAMKGTQKMIINVMSNVFSNKQLKDQFKKDVIKWDEAKYNSFIEEIKGLNTLLNPTSKQDSYDVVKQETYGHKFAKYGYGLAPFFISIAMWVGGMVMTFSVHRKIYNKEYSPGTRYLAKWLLICFGICIQATILMTALYFIGFNKLGIDNWFKIYGFAIYSGIIFASILQAIRFSIPSRNISILLSIIFLILQMASGGGLFPIETQSKFYRILHSVLPIGHSINVFRELYFDTRVDYVLKEAAFLLVYPAIFVPLGIYFNRKLTIDFYMTKGWHMNFPLHPVEKKYINKAYGKEVY